MTGVRRKAVWGGILVLVCSSVGATRARADAGQAIRIRPRVVMRDGAVWLTCRVPRDAANRRLNYGVVDLRDSARQLDGDAAPALWQVLIDHIPCGVGPAYCVITTATGRQTRVVVDVPVTGCDAGS
jgi:hypothetical protein